MRYAIIVVVFGLYVALGCEISWGEHRYNPYTRDWETVPSNSQLRYNVRANNWSYQPKGTQLEYNPFKNLWEWSSGLNGGQGCGKSNTTSSLCNTSGVGNNSNNN